MTARAGPEYAVSQVQLSAQLIEAIEQGQRFKQEHYADALLTARFCAASVDSLFGDAEVIIAPSAVGEAPATLASTATRVQPPWQLLGCPVIGLPFGTGSRPADRCQRDRPAGPRRAADRCRRVAGAVLAARSQFEGCAAPRAVAARLLRTGESGSRPGHLGLQHLRSADQRRLRRSSTTDRPNIAPARGYAAAGRRNRRRTHHDRLRVDILPSRRRSNWSHDQHLVSAVAGR